VKNSERSHRGNRPWLLPGALYLLAGIVSSRVPLLNYLGYESSFLFALVASIVAGCTVIVATQRAVRASEGAGWSAKEIAGLFWKQLSANFLLLLIPLAILSANALLVKNCAWWEGFGFYLLLPCVSAWFSAALGLFCAVHYRRARLVFFAAMVASLLYAVFLGYATPAIFSYNFFYGYFPGFTYDEVLGISLPLILFRLLTVGLGGVFLWLALLLVRTSKPGETVVMKGKALLMVLVAPAWRVVAGSVVALLLVLYVFRCEMRWESTAEYIQSQLGGRYDTPRVTVYYSPTALSPAAIRRIAGEHEFRLAQLIREFGVSTAPHIESYVYPDAAAKQHLIGAGNTNIAKPWSGEVHCTLQSLEATLKHELAHVVAAPFGLPIIRASLSTGLVEGLATAVDGTWQNRTLHQCAAALQKFGPKPDIRELMTFRGFVAENTALSYVAAGSFCRYLIDAYGMKPLLAVYGKGEYAGAFGKPLPELVREWERFLGRVRVEDQERDVVESFFRQPPIFRKTCARVIAGRNEVARIASAGRDYARARDLYRASFEEAGGYEAFGGLLASTVRLGDYASAVRLCDSVIAGSAAPGRYLPLFLWYGDARWAVGDSAGARQLFRRLRDVDLADYLTEGAALRLLFLDDSLHRADLLPLFLSGISDSVRIVMLDSLARMVPEKSPLFHYLAGRALARRGEHASAVARLESLDLSAFSLPLEHFRRKTLGEEYYLLHNYDLARTAFWLSLNGLTNETATIEAREWVTRCDWMARHGY